jgi:hypothetical protein
MSEESPSMRLEDADSDDPQVLPFRLAIEISLLSEPSLEDWIRPEEEASWAYLHADIV